MPHLTPAQLAFMRSVKADNYSDALDVYRAPAVASDRRGAVAVRDLSGARPNPPPGAQS